ncbi:MAG: FecR domain-containing protein [Bauldia sp.]
MRITSVVVAVAIVAAGGLAPALAAEPAGEAVAVVQSAAAEGAVGSRLLAVDGPVFMGDLVTTDAAGQAQLRFRDDTRMVVGPNSSLTIDSFVVADPTTAKQLSINAVRGAFRFITGNSPKSAYTINTPVATIGVRGTRFDFSVLDDGTANLALYDDGKRGAAYFCDKQLPRRHCTLVSAACTLVTLSPDNEFRWVKNVYERTAAMDDLFPLAFRQSGLDPEFRVASGACDIRDLELRDPGEPSEAPPAPVEAPCEGDCGGDGGGGGSGDE